MDIKLTDREEERRISSTLSGHMVEHPVLKCNHITVSVAVRGSPPMSNINTSTLSDLFYTF